MTAIAPAPASVCAIAAAGMRSAEAALQRHAGRIARADPAREGAASLPAAGTSGPEPSLADDVVGMLQAKNAFLVNLAVFKIGTRSGSIDIEA